MPTYDVFVPIEVLFTVQAKDRVEAEKKAYDEATRQALLYKIENDTYEIMEQDPFVDEVEEE